MAGGGLQAVKALSKGEREAQAPAAPPYPAPLLAEELLPAPLVPASSSVLVVGRPLR